MPSLNVKVIGFKGKTDYDVAMITGLNSSAKLY